MLDVTQHLQALRAARPPGERAGWVKTKNREVWDDFIAEALEEVNRIRTLLEREPLIAMPKGTRQDAHGCPIAVALSKGWNAEVDDDNITLTTWVGDPDQRPDLWAVAKRLVAAEYRVDVMTYNDNYSYGVWKDMRYVEDAVVVALRLKLPPVLQKFIRTFDAGLLEELTRTSVLIRFDRWG